MNHELNKDTVKEITLYPESKMAEIELENGDSFEMPYDWNVTVALIDSVMRRE